jgi:hypothetical protein
VWLAAKWKRAIYRKPAFRMMNSVYAGTKSLWTLYHGGGLLAMVAIQGSRMFVARVASAHFLEASIKNQEASNSLLSRGPTCQQQQQKRLHFSSKEPSFPSAQ